MVFMKQKFVYCLYMHDESFGRELLSIFSTKEKAKEKMREFHELFTPDCTVEFKIVERHLL